jgi:hypothetical protein
MFYKLHNHSHLPIEHAQSNTSQLSTLSAAFISKFKDAIIDPIKAITD